MLGSFNKIMYKGTLEGALVVDQFNSSTAVILLKPVKH